MQLHVEVDQPAQGVGDGGGVGVPHAGVADHADGVVGGSCFKFVGVGGQERGQANAAAFFFALNHDGDVTRQEGVGVAVGLERLQKHHDLALVVAGSAGVELAVADRRFERPGRPALQRVGGLHVVVAVEQHPASGARDHDRVGCGGDDDGVPAAGAGGFDVQAQLCTEVGNPGGGAVHVGFVGRVGADAGDLEQVDEPLDGGVGVVGEMG